jgi:hypothetical protein
MRGLLVRINMPNNSAIEVNNTYLILPMGQAESYDEKNIIISNFWIYF